MIIDLGVIGYGEAYAVQRELVRRRSLSEIGDSLILAEHPNVLTIGRSGSPSSILAGEEDLRRLGISCLRVDRGGDATYHGPGQALAYPVIDLKARGRDLHIYMRDLEAGVIAFLRPYGVTGTRVAGRTGVWVDGGKIASIGIAARDWITYHGVSVNIDTDNGYFGLINPCGMAGLRMAALSDIIGTRVPMAEAVGGLARSFKAIFGLEGDCERMDPADVRVSGYGAAQMSKYGGTL